MNENPSYTEMLQLWKSKQYYGDMQIQSVYEQVKKRCVSDSKHIYGNKKLVDNLLCFTLFILPKNKNLSLILDKRGCIGNTLKFVTTMTNYEISQSLHLFLPKKLYNNTWILTILVVFEPYICVTVTSIDSFINVHKYLHTTDDIYIYFNDGKYVYIYNTIKKKKEKLHKELLNSEALVRIQFHPRNVEHFINTHNDTDIDNLLFDEM